MISAFSGSDGSRFTSAARLEEPLLNFGALREFCQLNEPDPTARECTPAGGRRRAPGCQSNLLPR